MISNRDTPKLAVIDQRHPQSPGRRSRRPNYARWRALSLSLVYILFAIHIVHWKVTGQTLAPLELNEVMYTLELGIITAGFLFMCFLVTGTLIFGRFFCSWACHIMVLQELSAWLLRKLGIRAKAIRSRLLLLVPSLTAFYMFIWPQIVRAWHERAFPTFHFATDREGWASFVTNNFWRNLPGPWVIALTFLVCGFLMVYMLGSRTFCTYVCPYGAILTFADRFAPGRIRVDRGRCEQCGLCTATCSSSIRVHNETAQFGIVVNPACLKCMDCVSVCPQSALSYRFTTPALLKSYKAGGRFGLPYDFSIAEELLAAFVFIFVLLSFRGLYGRIPFLLSLALGIIMGYLSVLTMRTWTQVKVSLSTVPLKLLGKLTRNGYAFQACMVFLTAFVVHSAFVRFHEYSGLRQAIAMTETTDSSTRDSLAASAHDHLLAADRWGLVANERVERSLITTASHLKKFEDFAVYSERYLNRRPDDAQIRLNVARTLLLEDRFSDAENHLRWIVLNVDPQTTQGRPLVASAYDTLGNLFARRGDFASAAELLRAALQVDPDRPRTHADLGSALAELGQFDQAIEHLQRAVGQDPTLAGGNYNLGTLLLQTGRLAEAVACFEGALLTTPDDVDVHNNLGSALLQLGRPDEALIHFQRAIALDAKHADAHFNLGRLLLSRNDVSSAEAHLRLAASLDPRYARLLTQLPSEQRP